jgi:Putative ABC-transporter type IV
VIWQQWISGGIGGLLIEVIFTGLYSSLSGNIKLTCQTSLWMILVYGTARCLFDYLDLTLHYNRFIMACMYTPLIYLQEFAWGYLFLKILKKRLWDYGLSHWTPLGLINLKYLPAWFTLALFFDKISSVLKGLEVLVFK